MTFPEIFFLVSTHVVLGAGVALLVSQRLTGPRRKQTGLALTALGIITGVPRVKLLLRAKERETEIASGDIARSGW